MKKEKTGRIEIIKQEEKKENPVDDLIKDEDNKDQNSTANFNEIQVAKETSFINEKPGVKEELSSIRETAEFESELAVNRKTD